jgi:DNA-binding NarL/FixJ family response regulator
MPFLPIPVSGSIAMARSQTLTRSNAAHGGSAPDLDSFVDNLPGNVYRRVRRTNGTYVFEYLSNGLFRQFGIDHRRLLSEDAIRFDWIHPDDKERFVTDLEMSAATLGMLDHRIRIVGENGSVYWARGIARPSRRPDGSVVWDGIVINVTREIEAEAALRVAKEEADRAHREATAVISSAVEDLRFPISMVASLARDLKDEPGDNTMVVSRLEAILNAFQETSVAPVSSSRQPSARGLTPRQQDVLRLMQRGFSNKAIAQKLGITPGTAKLHSAAVLRARGVRGRKELHSGA